MHFPFIERTASEPLRHAARRLTARSMQVNIRDAFVLGETMRRLATAFVLGLMACVAFVEAASAQEQLTFRIRSNYEFKVQIAFFSANRVWPGVGRAWNLDDFKVHEYTLNCRSGEKICYGAWVTGNANKYWGVGSRNERYCKSCCYVCGDSDMTPVINLDDG